ncbi:MAG: hypothetical protein IJE46_06460 [Clostridia bacterium]|nr:hypothetical protein [Clostridia bacterium]
MKKILSLVVCMVLFLSACSNGNQVLTETIDIPFQKVAACNNRQKLLEKFGYVSERTASRAERGDDYNYWTLYFEKEGESTNAILDYSVEYKCYYYNNEIFTEYGDGEIRTVLPYRESYEKVMASLLARSDTLSYVFIIESNCMEDEEDGYIAQYKFIVNNDILQELDGLGLEAGDRVLVEYELDKDYIIKRCKYKRIEENREVEVARIDITYGEKRAFPTAITSRVDESTEFVNVNIIENFGTGAQYSEMFKVKKGTYIAENNLLLTQYLFKDPIYKTVFDTMVEKIQEDTDIFILDSEYAATLQRQSQEVVDSEQKQDI